MGLFGNKKAKTLELKGGYMSSHPDIKFQKRLKLIFSDAGVDAYGENGKDLVRHFNWDEIIGFDAQHEKEETSSQRVTVTRMAAMGVFALGAQKKEGSVKGRMFDILYTTTGNIELQSIVAGGAPSGLTGTGANLTLTLHDAKGMNIKRFVNDRANGQKN